MPDGLAVTHPSLGTGKDTLKSLPYQEEQICKCQHDIHQCKDEECFHRISLYINIRSNTLFGFIFYTSEGKKYLPERRDRMKVLIEILHHNSDVRCLWKLPSSPS